MANYDFRDVINQLFINQKPDTAGTLCNAHDAPNNGNDIVHMLEL